ncbi:Fe(3+) ABC transporter substrate-binding protein [Spirulina sp. CS-785/01]|uniref:Fe(3+) ABC transporter substrate-binding protein n=1 Tax=Spirulina sp. CS-785/01 TaxID=3021716 RepID=UPI003FA765E5
MLLKKRPIFTILSGLAVALAAGCSSSTPTDNPNSNDTATQPTGEVNLYTSRHYDADEALYENFTEETGIELNLIEGSAEELIERIKSEGENSPADVLITVDVGNLWRAQQAGILQPVESEVLENAIPANFREDEGHWFGLTKRARILVYNKDNVDPENLSTYEDLANPEWEGRICVRSSSNIYNQSLVASKIEEMGLEKAQEWVNGLVNNFAREPEGNDTSQIQSVASGECDLAIVNSYYVARMMNADDAEAQEIAEKVGVFFPSQEAGGTHVNISGAGVVANAPHQENAVTFIEYLTTPEAQKIFANANYEYPVVEEVTMSKTVEKFGDFKESSLDVESYGEKNAEAVKVMDRAGWK